MDPTSLVPYTDTIPVPWGWFKLLLILTFLLHIILMNFMLGGSLLTLFRRSGSGGSGPAPPEGKSLPTLVALTINLGVPPLLFVQVLFGQFLYSSSVLMAVYWISVIPVLILAYYASYGYVAKSKQGSGIAKLWLGVSALLMLAIAFMFSNNMTLMLQPERWAAYFDRPGGTILNLSEPTLFPRYLHFVVGAIAIAGLGRAILYALKGRREGREYPEEVRGGLRIFAITTMVQMLVGVLFWIVLPGRIGSLFLGGSVMHTAHLWLGIVAALVAVLLALRGKLWATTILITVTLLMMILTRDLVRTAYLAPYFSPSQLEVAPQVSPMIAFLLAFLAVIGVLVYMLREAWRAGEEVSS